MAAKSESGQMMSLGAGRLRLRSDARATAEKPTTAACLASGFCAALRSPANFAKVRPMPKTIEHVHWPDAPNLWMPYAPAIKVRGGTPSTWPVSPPLRSIITITRKSCVR